LYTFCSNPIDFKVFLFFPIFTPNVLLSLDFEIKLKAALGDSKGAYFFFRVLDCFLEIHPKIERVSENTIFFFSEEWKKTNMTFFGGGKKI
jgi:hypothetical protein